MLSLAELRNLSLKLFSLSLPQMRYSTWESLDGGWAEVTTRWPWPHTIHWLCSHVCLVTQLCLILCDPMDCSPPGSSVTGNSPGKNTGVGCHALFHGIFPTQGSNPGLVHCRQILYHLSHQGSPRTLHWVAYPFSRGSSPPRNQTGVSYIAGGFFSSWVTREAHITQKHSLNLSFTSKTSSFSSNTETWIKQHFRNTQTNFG